MTVFAKDVLAYYDGYEGTIRFVCNHYISFCIHQDLNHKSRDVCILIYRKDYSKLKLSKESEK
jgi:hypothetical protein